MILHWSRRAALGEGQPVNVQTAEGTEAVFRHRTHTIVHETADRPFMGLDNICQVICESNSQTLPKDKYTADWTHPDPISTHSTALGLISIMLLPQIKM